MSPHRRNPSSWLQVPLAFTFCVCLQVIQVVYAYPTNFTVEDDDPSIRYSPSAAWKWSWDAVPIISPSFEGGRKRLFGRGDRDPTYPSVEYDRRAREGGGIGGSADSDQFSAADMDSSAPSSIPKTKRRRTLSPPAQLMMGNEDGRPTSQRLSNADFAFLQFDFTGSAVYLFAHSPLPSSSVLTIDGRLQSLPTSGIDSDSEFPPMVSVDAGPPNHPFYSNRTLHGGPHSIILTIPLRSDSNVVFAFDRIVYTQDVTPAPKYGAPPAQIPTFSHVRRQEPSTSSTPISGSSSTTATEGTPPTSATPSSTDPSKKRNIATFGAAVGGSVGLLALFSAGLALSIVRRRYLAKKRERHDREARPEFPDPLNPNSSQDVRRTVRRAQVFGDEGIFGGRGRRGQARDMEERRGGSFSSDSSFVPRFFPGTEVPPPAASPTMPSQAGHRDTRHGSLDEPPPPMYHDALEAPVVPPPGLVTHHPYIHRARAESRASIDSSDELGLPIMGRARAGVTGRGDLSYADIPPSDPPPPDVVAAAVGASGPPPSFPEAMASASSLPVPPLPVHQARSTRSFQSIHSNGRLHPTEAPSDGRPEVAPLLHPTSTSRPASVSSNMELASGARRGP